MTVRKQLLPAAQTNVNQLRKMSITEGFYELLGAPAKLRRVTISFVMSVRPHGTTRLPLDVFSINLMLEDLSKTCRENSRFIKIGQTK